MFARALTRVEEGWAHAVFRPSDSHLDIIISERKSGGSKQEKYGLVQDHREKSCSFSSQ